MTKVPTKAEIRAKVIAEIEPWDGPESKSPAAFIRAGILSGADQFAIWKGVTIRWPDYRGSGGFATIGTYLRRLTASEHLNEKGKPTKKGKELLAELQGDREGRGRLAPIPPWRREAPWLRLGSLFLRELLTSSHPR